MPLARALKGETSQPEELILHPKDGKLSMWISMSAQPLKNENGGVSGAIVVFRDISYRKQVEISREKHAKRAEALYTLSRSIVELGDDLDQIMNTVALQTSNFIGDACIATLIDEGGGLKIAAMHHPNPHARALFRELTLSPEFTVQQSGTLNGVIQSGEPLLILPQTPTG
jgi:hypothetical protein